MSTSPDYIQFYPTLRCNKACDFCFNKGMPRVPDMQIGQFRKMLGILKPARVRTIDIMGGEPTLHPDIERMISDAEDAGFLLNISSNGTDLPMLGRITKSTKQTTVGISVNDRNELKDLKGFIERYHPVVKTVFRRGVDLAMVDDILALRPKRFFFLFPDAMQAADLGWSIAFDRFLAVIQGRFKNDAIGTVFCSGFLPDIGTHPGLAKVRCPAGSTKLGVLPDGAVYPCNLFFGRKEFLLGNIFTDPFKKIKEHPGLAFFRTFTGNACPRTSCKLHDQCHGGCPVQSLAHSGELSAPDPRCL